MSPKTKRKISKGTGKRYASSKPRPVAEAIPRVHPPAPSQAEKVLRKRIPKFVFRGDRFKADIEKAMGLYFEQKSGPDTPLEFDEDELPGFQEWFFSDFVTLTGRRIIDMFLEEIGPSLNSEQRTMLEDWLVWNRARLLEFQEVKPGIGVVMQDLLSAGKVSGSSCYQHLAVVQQRGCMIRAASIHTARGTPGSCVRII